ncbi:MAG TPA: hypothetical protein VMA77_25945 [Solirubrobacteraceae bacterium]|nr:hypothetical protein [Solirubrobacteraceae bacterium]
MNAPTPSPSILVSYDGQPIALVNRRHTTLVGQAADLPTGHPLLRTATWMAAYAKLVATNELPGPYKDPDAERFARAALIDPEELRKRPTETDETLAVRFQVPIRHISLARAEMP